MKGILTGAADITDDVMTQQAARGQCPREPAQLRSIIRRAGFPRCVPLDRDSAARSVASARRILAD